MTRWSGVRVAIVPAINAVSIKERNVICPFYLQKTLKDSHYGIEGLNVINETKCNKVLNVITFCHKCNKVVKVVYYHM